MSATNLASQAMRSLVGDDFQHMIANTDYDKFIVVGAEKPSKEAFETKLQQLIEEHKWKDFRQERNQRLAEVDWIFSTDYHIPNQMRDEWTRYRQALRDLPSLTEDPENPVWPEKPTVNPSGGSTVSVDLDHLAGIASQVTLLQNVVFQLTKRIEQLEQA